MADHRNSDHAGALRQAEEHAIRSEPHKHGGARSCLSKAETRRWRKLPARMVVRCVSHLTWPRN
jgi:hypothetical protein